MLRITRETDYAVRLLAQMGCPTAERVAAREASEWIGVSVPMASKVLKALTRAGILQSNRGARGGYRLARPLERISIGDVIAAVEGPIGLVDCLAHPGNCDHEGCCRTKLNWWRVNQVIAEALDAVPVSDMASPPSLLTVGGGAGR